MREFFVVLCDLCVICCVYELAVKEVFGECLALLGHLQLLDCRGRELRSSHDLVIIQKIVFFNEWSHLGAERAIVLFCHPELDGDPVKRIERDFVKRILLFLRLDV